MNFSTALKAALVVVAAHLSVGCAKQSGNSDPPDQSQGNLLQTDQDTADYNACVSSQARLYASDANSDAIAPNDVATASLSHCSSILSRYRSDFVTEVESKWQGRLAQQPAHLDDTADELVAHCKEMARNGAVTLVIDTRRMRTASHVGSLERASR